MQFHKKRKHLLSALQLIQKLIKFSIKEVKKNSLKNKTFNFFIAVKRMKKNTKGNKIIANHTLFSQLKYLIA